MSSSDRFDFAGKSVPFSAGDDVLTALLRAGFRPTSGGCLCFGGDCPHCLATIDGVSYVRTCQTKARAGMQVVPHPENEYPSFPAHCDDEHIPARTLHADVVVIGQGESGRAAAATARAAGKSVITFEADEGQEAVGVYPGPMVVARTNEGMLHVQVKDEVVVATGAAELHAVAPGNELSGIVTARAAEKMNVAGIPLGRVVAVGVPPNGVDCTSVIGEIVRFEGKTKVEAVVIRDQAGQERRLPCDTVALGLGLQPRNALMRMGKDWSARAVGDATRTSDLPPCPKAGKLCHCAGIDVEDLKSVTSRGFHALELVKRSTLAGTGTCQGMVCVPHIRSFLSANGHELQPPFTARPVNRQLTIGEAAAGSFHHPTARTALDQEHRRLGGRMDRMGGWWRPADYGAPDEEYRAVRERVSLGDVSTLGKFLLTGPGALDFLERLYPTKVSTIKPGGSRYVLLLDERGYVMDDGMVVCEGPNRYFLTFTSAGSTNAEAWMRDWAESWNCDIRLMNLTWSLGAINVTGPKATELMASAGLANPPAFLKAIEATVAGVPCRVVRLSFTGEVSYELHHSVADSVKLWRTLLELGAKFGIRPHGLDTLMRLRLEKGHIVVGQDTELDSTPRRIAHEWAVKMEKADFIGKEAIERTNKQPIDRQLVGFAMDGAAPPEGAVVWHGSEYAGYVTSSGDSLVLGKAVMLGWLNYFDGALPEEVTIGGSKARRVPTPFYDAEGQRARA